MIFVPNIRELPRVQPAIMAYSTELRLVDNTDTTSSIP